MLREHTVEMLQGLIDIARTGEKAIVVDGCVQYVRDDSLRAHVMNTLLDRGIGKAPVMLDTGDGDGSPRAIGIVFVPMDGGAEK